MNKLSVHDSKGSLTLGKLLGRGGEGAVYEIVSRPDCAAKVYHQPMPVEKAAKIETMAAMRSDRLLSVAAWPLDLLRSPQGQPCGLIMPMVSGHKDIHTLYGPKSRKVNFPNADWRFLIRAAANTARAFAAMHESNCIIGDVNHGGVRVSDNATATLIDCDCFQISAGGRTFLCEVGVDIFTPPELQARSFRGLTRSANHDNFGLAILIFQLLFMGRHPYAGSFLGRGEKTIAEAIAEFRFVYSSNRASVHMKPPPNVPSITIASQSVALLMERAFSCEGVREGVRPSAREWITVLEQLEKQLKCCQVNASHHYLRDLDHCPWCHVEAAIGIVVFSFVAPRGSQHGTVEVSAIWVKIEAIPPPGPAPTIVDWSHLPPSAEVIAVKQAEATKIAVKKVFGFVSIFGVIGILLFTAPAAFILWLLLGVFVSRKVADWATPRYNVGKFKQALQTAEEHWKTTSTRWDQEASDTRFLQKLRELEQVRDLLLQQPHFRQKRYQELERDRHRQQLRGFLDRFEIARAAIPSIGPGRKAMLESYNIDTACDLTRERIMGVPGFGPALAAELMRWRLELERQFRFDPSKGVDPQEIASLDREISGTKRKLEQILFDGRPTLNQVREHILARRLALKPTVDEAARVLAQARADFKVFHQP